MPCNCGNNGNWKAILDKMPPTPPRLRVTGTALCTTTGYKNVRLEPVRPPGINRQILLLELKWDAPSGHVGDLVTPHDVEYEERDSPSYSEVEIVNCNRLRIKVETVT